MLVPGTGDDPVTSCFSDTLSKPLSRIKTPQSAIFLQTWKGFRQLVGVILPTTMPTARGAA
jgi:hypothetical protein